MNSIFGCQIAKYRQLFTLIIPYKRKLIFSTSLAFFLLSLVARVLRSMSNQRKFKTLSKNQKKTLLKSKLFFNGIFKKVKIELTGNEGIKYSKTQMFLDKIVNNYQMKQKMEKKINLEKESKQDKVFYCILNNYLNKK